MGVGGVLVPWTDDMLSNQVEDKGGQGRSDVRFGRGEPRSQSMEGGGQIYDIVRHCMHPDKGKPQLK